jgi:hypothetical protein
MGPATCKAKRDQSTLLSVRLPSCDRKKEKQSSLSMQELEEGVEGLSVSLLKMREPVR